MPPKFNALRPKKRSDFDSMVEHLLHEAKRVWEHREFWLAFEASIEEYSDELNRTPNFWNLTITAHRDTVILRLARLYDSHKSVLSLGNFLQTLRENVSTKSSCFPNELAHLSIVDLEQDLERVSTEQRIVAELERVRNEYVAHRNTRFILDAEASKRSLLQADDITSLVDCAVNIMEKYHSLLGYRPLLWGSYAISDYQSLLETIGSRRQKPQKD